MKHKHLTEWESRALLIKRLNAKTSMIASLETGIGKIKARLEGNGDLTTEQRAGLDARLSAKVEKARKIRAEADKIRARLNLKCTG